MKATVISLAAGLLAVLLAGCQDPRPSKQTCMREGLNHLYAADYVQAIGRFKAAAAIDPEDTDALYYIGHCYSYLDQYDDAIFWYRQSLTAFPGNADARREMAQAQQRLRSRPSATSAPDDDPLVRDRQWAQKLIDLARQAEESGDLTKAEQYFQRATDVNVNLAYPHAELGRFYKRQGRIDEAIEALQKACAINPAEAGVSADLAVLRAGN